MVTDPLDTGIDELWERSRPTMARRIETVERWATASVQGIGNDELLRQARRDAHQLAGSLAMLGYSRACDVARAIDRALREGEPPPDPRAILAQAARLRERLDEPRARLEPVEDPDPSGWRAASWVLTVLDAPVDAADREQPPEPPVTAPVEPGRILLADDDDVIAGLIEIGLGLDGHQVVRVRDGRAAIRAARERPFDMILLDVQMPGLGGFEVCKTLRADSRTAGIPKLLLTAQSDGDHVQAGFASGANDYLTKPFAVSQLRARVRSWLARASEPHH